MKWRYLISSTNNPVYNGLYRLGDRFETYGQHSFVLDFVTVCLRMGVDLDVCIEGIDRFPLSRFLGKFAKVSPIEDGNGNDQKFDTVIIDGGSEHLFSSNNQSQKAIIIVHNATQKYQPIVVQLCDYFVCMTENAASLHRLHVPEEKISVIHQGIDLNRFQPKRTARGNDEQRALVISRLQGSKGRTIHRVVTALVQAGIRVTVLGDGEGFWPLSDEFGDRITLINHIPCHSVHNFLPEFDVVFSSGRGVMEAMACGNAAIIAGNSYGGLVSAENVCQRLEYNLAGWGDNPSLEIDFQRIAAAPHDFKTASVMSSKSCRGLAEEHFDMARFVQKLVVLTTTCSAARSSAVA